MTTTSTRAFGESDPDETRATRALLKRPLKSDSPVNWKRYKEAYSQETLKKKHIRSARDNPKVEANPC